MKIATFTYRDDNGTLVYSPGEATEEYFNPGELGEHVDSQRMMEQFIIDNNLQEQYDEYVKNITKS